MRTSIRPSSAALIAVLTVAVLAALLATPTPADAQRATASTQVGDIIDEEIELGPDATLAIIHPAEGISLHVLAAAIRASGLQVAGRFPHVGVMSASGPGTAFAALASTGLVSRVEYDAPIQLLLDSSQRATGGQDVLDGAVTLDGITIDGTGVGVAVLDSGLDGTHPALRANTAGNLKVLFPTAETASFEDTDTISAGGHGTHVSGIIASNDGTYRGAAPGASLFAVSIGTAISIRSGVEGMEWVLANHDKVTPNIRVVNNSWGSAARDYEPDNVQSIAVRKLIEAGVTVVFAAGNDGGDGSSQRTSPYCVDPTPGVLCVANYDDAGTGTRDGTMSPFSSRGAAGQANTYPDLSAPGTSITSTCRPHLPLCPAEDIIRIPIPGPAALLSNLTDDYAPMSGTSMAAPHISGIVAQMYQANPDLTPAQVEDILEDTAHPFTAGAAYEADPSNPDSLTSLDKGHGLVDAVAALTAALAL